MKINENSYCVIRLQMGNNAVMTAIREGWAAAVNRLWPFRASLDVNHQNIVRYVTVTFVYCL